jgi:hypothetical protein
MKFYFIALYKGKVVEIQAYSYDEMSLRDKTFDFWQNMLDSCSNLEGCKFDEIQKFDKVL